MSTPIIPKYTTTPRRIPVIPPLAETMLPSSLEARNHAAHSVRTWKKINFYLVLPALLLVSYITIPKELQHIRHLKEHAKEWVPIAYLRKRKNPYPWGMDNLFYYPNANPKPPEE